MFPKIYDGGHLSSRDHAIFKIESLESEIKDKLQIKKKFLLKTLFS